MRADLKIALSVLTVLLSVFLVGVTVAAAGPYGSTQEMYGAPGMSSSSTGQSYSDQSFTFEGRVLWVDPEQKAVTVEAIDKNISASSLLEGEVTLGADENTKVMMCNYGTSLDDIKAGERVNITYHGEIGKIFADDIRAAEC